jgi:AbrB family looped-hinge helix DNA binding protein
MEIKIDSKGRINIPQTIQRDLNLCAGDTFSIEVSDNGIVLTPLNKDKHHISKSIIVLSGTPKDKPRYFTM